MLKQLLNWLRGPRPESPPQPMPGDWVTSFSKREGGLQPAEGMFLLKNGDRTVLLRCREGQSFYDIQVPDDELRVIPDNVLLPGYEIWVVKRREGLYKGVEAIKSAMRRPLLIWRSDEFNWGVALIGSSLTLQYMGWDRVAAVGALVKRNPEFFAVNPTRERFFVNDTAQRVGEAVLNNPSRFGVFLDDQSEFFPLGQRQ